MHQGTSLTELCGQGKHLVSFIETPRTPSEKTLSTVVCYYLTKVPPFKGTAFTL